MVDNASRIGSMDTEIVIDASPDTVWQALTDEIGIWWPEDFYAGGEAGKRSFSLEAAPGGRMFEVWDGGGGTLWGIVVCAQPGAILQVLGNQFPNWGGPTQWYGSWSLSEADRKTRLAFSETIVGNVTANSLKEKEKGWQYLWATLKAHVEGVPAPVWGAIDRQ